MGQFEKGDTKEYEKKYCFNCENYGGGSCPILDLHFIWAGHGLDINLGSTKKSALDHFIPLTRDGDNAKCTMWVESSWSKSA